MILAGWAHYGSPADVRLHCESGRALWMSHLQNQIRHLIQSRFPTPTLMATCRRGRLPVRGFSICGSGFVA